MAREDVNLEKQLEIFNGLPNEQQQREYLLNMIRPKEKNQLSYTGLSLQDLLVEAFGKGKRVTLLTNPKRTRMQ